jgi:hypothetical protein
VISAAASISETIFVARLLVSLVGAGASFRDNPGPLLENGVVGACSLGAEDSPLAACSVAAPPCMILVLGEPKDELPLFPDSAVAWLDPNKVLWGLETSDWPYSICKYIITARGDINLQVVRVEMG